MSDTGLPVDEVTLARLAREARSPIADAVELDDPIPLTDALKDALPSGRGAHLVGNTEGARAAQAKSREAIREKNKTLRELADIQRERGILAADLAITEDIDLANGRLESVADRAVRRNLSLLLNGGAAFQPRNAKEAAEIAKACAAIASSYRTGRAADKIVEASATEQLTDAVKDRLLQLAARAKLPRGES